MNSSLEQNNVKVKQLEITWRSFLIYFALFASAILCFGYGFLLTSGALYGGKREFVYSRFPFLQPSEIIFGVALIAIAALMIVTRFALAKNKKIAPVLLTVDYLLLALVGIAYLTVLNLVDYSWLYAATTHSLLMFFAAKGFLIGGVAMTVINICYGILRKLSSK